MPKGKINVLFLWCISLFTFFNIHPSIIITLHRTQILPQYNEFIQGR